jgi:hypothetical protein
VAILSHRGRETAVHQELDAAIFQQYLHGHLPRPFHNICMADVIMGKDRRWNTQPIQSEQGQSYYGQKACSSCVLP